MEKYKQIQEQIDQLQKAIRACAATEKEGERKCKKMEELVKKMCEKQGIKEEERVSLNTMFKKKE